LLAANLVVTIVVAEVALQCLGAMGYCHALTEAGLDGFRLQPGIDYGAGLRGNQLGYPGPELPAKKRPDLFRIAAIGDSFAVGPAVPFADNYLTRLASELPQVEVANFGVAGAGPREYLEILDRDVWSIDPDLVLVSLFIGNDITESLGRPRGLDPRRYMVYVLCQRAWKVACEAWRGGGLRRDWPADRLAAPPLSLETFREVEARRLGVCLKIPPAGLEQKWLRALARLDGIVTSCRQRKVAVAFVLIPDEFQVNSAVLAQALASANLTEADLDLDGPQRRLLEFFEKLRVPCLDLLPAFQQTPDTFAPRDTHWNVAGNHLAAKCIANWLAQSQLPTRK
jgi:hypothetical protein